MRFRSLSVMLLAAVTLSVVVLAPGAGKPVPSASRCGPLVWTVNGAAVSPRRALARRYADRNGYEVILSRGTRSCSELLAPSMDAAEAGDEIGAMQRPPWAKAEYDEGESYVLFGGTARAARVTRVAASPRRGDTIALCVPEPVTFEEGGTTVRVSGLLHGKLCGDVP